MNSKGDLPHVGAFFGSAAIIKQTVQQIKRQVISFKIKQNNAKTNQQQLYHFF